MLLCDAVVAGDLKYGILVGFMMEMFAKPDL